MLALGVRQPDVSKHLGVLRKLGVVSVSKQGQQRVYDLNPDQLRPVCDWIKALEGHWEHQLDRIRTRAERRALDSRGTQGPTTQQKRNHMTTATQTQESIETFEIKKAIDIAAPIEIAFEAMIEELGPDAANDGWHTDALQAGSLAGRALVSRFGKQRRTSVGAGTGDQAADLA